MPDSQIKGLARKSARAIWWAVTPWRYGERLDYLRARTLGERRNSALAELADSERARLEGVTTRPGDASSPPDALSLLDARMLARLADVPVSALRLAVPRPSHLSDLRAAAAFVLDVWRTRADVRARFPTLFRDVSCDFVRWLRDEADSLSLTDDDLTQIELLFASDYSAQARQCYLAHLEVRALLPHGLTPAGLPALIRWFLRWGRQETGLALEELLWLFLRASQGPAEELLIALAFTPAWQQLHPDGATVFGREAFARWFADEYGARGPWLDASRWPEPMEPQAQLRTSYWAREAWQDAHPHALRSPKDAQALVDWLASVAAPIGTLARAWIEQHRGPALASALSGLGINVIGHFTYPSGLRVSAECLVQAAGTAGIAVALRDVRTDAKDDPHHVDYRGSECHDVTIIHTQPNPYFDDVYARADLAPRDPRTYRVAYWYWEFDSIPESWLAQAAQVDEVWAATEFVAKGLRERLALPVRTLFPGVRLGAFKQRPRSHFGLEEGHYTFLFAFHMMSVMERKNPLGLIQAFRAAFNVDEPVSLVLKTSFGDRHPAQVEQLRAAAEGSNIRIIDAVYSPDEVLSLMDACDAYVSLHRSEGLGLTMAEAMLLAKPVVATGYSGNVDFMDNDNSLLVPYTLEKLGRPIPPYDADSEWAEPSLSDAAQAMRRLFDDQNWARELGLRGQLSARHNLSLERAGRKIALRLEEIRTEEASRRKS